MRWSQVRGPRPLRAAGLLPLRDLQEALRRRRHRERPPAQRRGRDPRGRGAAAHLPAGGGHREDVLLGLRLEPLRRRLARDRPGQHPPERDRRPARARPEKHIYIRSVAAGRRSRRTASSGSTDPASAARRDQSEPDVGAAGRAVRRLRAAAVRLRDRAHDREAEPGARPCPPGVGRLNRSNACSRNAGGKPWPSSSTWSSTRAVDRGGAQVHAPARRGAARCRPGSRAPARAEAGRRGPAARSRRSWASAPRASSARHPNRRRDRRRAARPRRAARCRSGSFPRSERAIRSRSSASCARRSTSCGDQRTRLAQLLRRARRAAARARARSAAARAACAARGPRRRRSRARARARPRAARASRSASRRAARARRRSAGTGSRSPGVSAEISAARRRIASTGRSASPASR